jgi:hypothetical protein
MTGRHLTAYILIIVLLAALAWGWRRWRGEIVRARMIRWGIRNSSGRR